VTLVCATSVVFGLDWTAAPLPPMPETEASVQAAKLAAVFPPPPRQVAQVERKPTPVPTQPQQGRPQQKVAVANPAPAPARSVTPAPAIMAPEQNPAQADAAAQSKCDVSACSAAYRSFRAEDCTWQPYDGPRRFCDKGTPPGNIASIDGKSGDTTASIGGEPITVSNKCDVAACRQAYFTFDPVDCTYQPSPGPRRLCERGTPPKQDAAAKPDTTAEAKPPADEPAKAASDAGNPKCNVEACRQAYFTFTAEDCTYQPSMGPRRLCTK
jgi:hypothetical protein